MCRHKAAQQQICICFLFPSGDAKGMCLQSLAMGPLPSPARLDLGKQGIPCCVEKKRLLSSLHILLRWPEDGPRMAHRSMC